MLLFLICNYIRFKPILYFYHIGFIVIEWISLYINVSIKYTRMSNPSTYAYLNQQSTIRHNDGNRIENNVSVSIDGFRIFLVVDAAMIAIIGYE